MPTSHDEQTNGGGCSAGEERLVSTIPLNIFQRLVRQWDDLHPYNGAQVIQIRSVADVTQLRRAWHEALDALGLGCVSVNGQHYRHECMNGQAATHTVEVLDPTTPLDDFLSAAINHRFAEEDEAVPFRPFILQSADTFWMGVVYQHWVADSASIRQVLKEWFVRAFDPKSASQRRVRLPHGGYWRLFGPAKAHWELAEGVLSSLRWAIRFRRVRRIEGKRFGQFDTRFTWSQLPDGLIEALRARARALDATVNDVFLAAIAEACDQHIPTQRTRRRQDLALGTIVDLRPHVREDLSQVFGLFLGFTSVICRPRHFRSWNTLLTSVSTQSALHKQSGVPQASFVRMMAGVAAGRIFSTERVTGFYRKRVPLSGGISNVNLNGTWASQYFPDPLLNYIRVSPTGPMMPLVFTTTTLGNRLNVGLTYRQSVVSDETAKQISQQFCERLIRVVGATKKELATDGAQMGTDKMQS